MFVLVIVPILLVLPAWTEPGGFPSDASGVSLLLVIEVVAGAAGAWVAAMLAPRAPEVRGFLLGALVLLLNLATVLDPDSQGPLLAAILLVACVPPQTWLGIVLAARIRSRSAGLPLASAGAATTDGTVR